MRCRSGRKCIEMAKWFEPAQLVVETVRLGVKHALLVVETARLGVEPCSG